jgi:acyl-CoA reductase-like NAD-dependent aldehyde dehydrogenase
MSRAAEQEVVGNGLRLERENPAKPNQIVGRVPYDTPESVRAITAKAAVAQRHWAALSLEERADQVRQAVARIDNIPELGSLLAQEMGKPLPEAMGEIRFSLGLAADMNKRAMRLLAPQERGTGDGRRVVLRKPHGAVAAIVPWNAPIILSMTKVAPALLSGNAIVIKPSPLAPLCLTQMFRTIAEALPDGLLNVVNGDADVGDALLGAPEVSKIAFTGGPSVGRAVLAKAAERFLPCTLELGGNDPLIILEDFDIRQDQMEAIIWASFLNAGQVCMAAKRLYVHDKLVPQFVNAYVETARSIFCMGDPLAAGTNLGPVISAGARDHIEKLAAEAEASGGTIHSLLERQAATALDSGGYFTMPRLVTGLTPSANLVKHEQFGPIVPLLSWSDEEELLQMLSATPSLTASIWTPDTERAWAMAGRLDAGITMINAHNRSGMSLDLPFGGRGSSGLGREYADEGLLEYSSPYAVHQPAAASGAQYPS